MPMVLFPVISYVDLIVVLVVAWILASFPIYVAGKIISGKDTSFGSAMIAALIGPVVTLFFFIVITACLSPFLLGFAGVFGAIFALFALSYLVWRALQEPSPWSVCHSRAVPDNNVHCFRHNIIHCGTAVWYAGGGSGSTYPFL
ncbi:MAG: hypothetical protein AMDU1_APLC00009G0012 [Thermoplasmatales archaeon A-plasma]|nr:MAG: hypothetical protein AMDU1_APLC00009G0012 [Thermoplasmatales archaeon A-plasma]